MGKTRRTLELLKHRVRFFTNVLNKIWIKNKLIPQIKHFLNNKGACTLNQDRASLKKINAPLTKVRRPNKHKRKIFKSKKLCFMKDSLWNSMIAADLTRNRNRFWAKGCSQFGERRKLRRKANRFRFRIKKIEPNWRRLFILKIWASFWRNIQKETAKLRWLSLFYRKYQISQCKCPKNR